MERRVTHRGLLDFKSSVRNARFAIAGAGNQAQRILYYLSPLTPCCIIDNNPLKWESDFFGNKVLAPPDVEHYSLEIIILSSLNYFVMARQHDLSEREVLFILSPVELIYGYS